MTDQMTDDQWAVVKNVGACVPTKGQPNTDTEVNLPRAGVIGVDWWTVCRSHNWRMAKIKITAFLSSWGVPEERVKFDDRGVYWIKKHRCNFGVNHRNVSDAVIKFFAGTHDLDGEPVERCMHCREPLPHDQVCVEGGLCCSMACAKKYEEHLHPLVTIKGESPRDREAGAGVSNPPSEADSPTPRAWESDLEFFKHKASDAAAEAWRGGVALERLLGSISEFHALRRAVDECRDGYPICLDSKPSRDLWFTRMGLDAQAEGGGR